MTSLDEPRLHQALHDLATAPAPPDLGDRALTRARRIRAGRGVGVGVGALTLAGLLAIPFLPRAASGPTVGAAPAPAATCSQAPSAAKDVKRVDPRDWTDLVRITIAALPPRADYEMQSGYDLCVSEQGGAGANAVINLGPHREHGHLAVNLYQGTDPQRVPVDCAALAPAPARPAPPGSKLLFCTDATPTSPTVYGTEAEGQVTVGAVYPDKGAVVIESHGAYTGSAFTAPAISAEALRSVVTDPRLAALLR